MARPFDWHRFIMRKLRSDVRREVRRNRIRNEADLQAVVYLHLRKHARSTFGHSKWSVHNKPAMLGGWAKAVRYPDIVVAYNNKPRFAFELKDLRTGFNRGRVNRDREKLRSMHKRMSSVTKGYLLYIIHKEDWDDLEGGFYSGWDWESRFYFEVPILV